MARLAQPVSEVPELYRSQGEVMAAPVWQASQSCPLT